MTLFTVMTLVALAGQAQTHSVQQPATAYQRPATPEQLTAEQETLQLQVMLDRAGFSPGVIDGRIGTNTTKALARYRQQNGGDAPPIVPAVTTYVITAEDTAGPFAERIPADLVEQATLPVLAYTSVLEAIAERFHTTPSLLGRLNPQSRFAAGEQIQVPNVEPLIAPVEEPVVSPDALAAAQAEAAAQPTGTGGRRDTPAGRGAGPDARSSTISERPDVIVTVSKASSALTVQDTSGRVIFYAPVTTGSERDPLPLGEWKVNGIQFNPVFNYNPQLFWDADPAHSKTKLPAGPNNPVGLVWIDLSREHYGIHGTPEPSTVGRTQSHGCVRLTNWDALKLAGMVKPGTKIIFTEQP
jgi:lipoprotein-anchoring transpeptidase ErfK/SrfK